MPNTGGRIQVVSNQFMDDLANNEAEAVLGLTAEYQNRVGRLDYDIQVLDNQIAERVANGQSVPVSWMHKQDRYRSLIVQARDEFNKYGSSVGNQISQSSRYAINRAGDMAAAQLKAAYGGAGSLADIGGFNKLPAPAIERLHGNLTGRSPLKGLLNSYGGWAANTIEEEMRHSLASGVNPRQTMRNIKNRLDYAPTRAATMLRTEQLRAFRQATLDNYRANSDLVKAWVWNAHTGDRTCPICWAMHGTEWPLDEVMGTHPNCRCNMIPKTPTWEELGYPGIPEAGPDFTPGPQLFRGLGDAAQRRILGPRRFDLYKAGKIDLPDMVRNTYTRDWGDGKALFDIPTTLLNAERRIAQGLADEAAALAKPKRGRPKGSKNKPKANAREAELGLLPLPKDAPQWAKDVRKLQLDYEGTAPSIAKDAERVQKAGRILDDAAREYRLSPAYQKKMQEANQALTDVENEINRRSINWRNVSNQLHQEGMHPVDRKKDPRMIEAERLMTEAYAMKAEANRVWNRLQNDSHLEVLRQVRPLGPSKPMVFAPGSKSELKVMAEKMAQLLPQRWIDRAIDAHAPGIETRWVNRGYHMYDGPDKPVHIMVSGQPGPGAEATMLHELTHYVERVGVDIKTQERAFYDRRTAGEVAEHMGLGYRPEEVTKPDDFVSRYMGKDYGRSAWEVLTMGLEGILGPEYTSEAMDVRRDQDHLEWLLGMVGIVP